MIGGSYGGQNQFAIAGQDDRIDAIIPTITWNDLTYSLAPTPDADRRRQEAVDGPVLRRRHRRRARERPGQPEPIVGCPNFADEACTGALQLNTLGYPDAGTLALARHASVATYLEDIKVPTLLVQGQKDTLFNLQEAVATYRSLQAQGTPVKMVWQSWGHSGSKPVAGELDFGAASLRDSYLGTPLPGLDGPLRRAATAARPPARSSSTSATGSSTTPAPKAGTAIDAAYAGSSTFSGRRPDAVLLRRRRAEGLQGGAVGRLRVLRQRPGRAHVVLRDLRGRGRPGQQQPTDAPGTFVSFTTAPLAGARDVVGSPGSRAADTPAAG